jgi:Tfp pilus assembly protein PilF
MKRSLLTLVCLAAGCLVRPPPHPRALECNELCTLYLSQGDLTRAEVQCDLGLQFSPEYADLWVNKGLISLKSGREEKAKEYFIKALRYNQEQAQAYNNLGYIYSQNLEFGKAHDNFQRALRVNPDYLEARYNLALAHRGLKQNEKAKKELRTIVEISPNLADPHLKLGEIYLEEGEADDALGELDIATKLDPNFTGAWLMMGNAYMEKSRPCDAKESYASCIEVDADNPQCRNNITIAEKKCQLQSKALKDVSEREKTPQAEFSLALAAKTQGQVADEERAYKRCLKYDPKYPQCHFGLYELFKTRRDDKNAQTACKNFLKYATGPEFEAQAAQCQQYVGAP